MAPALRIDVDSFCAAAATLNRLQPENVISGNGSDDLLTVFCRAVVGPRDKVYYPWPTYSLYDVLVDIQEGINCPVDFPDDFSLPEALFANDGVLTFVANPNAPSGTVTPLQDLARLAQSLRGLLVVDEAYVDFAESDSVRLLRDHPNVIILRTLSKSYSLAGLRVGYALAQPSIIQSLRKVKDSYNLDRLAIAGAAAALEDVETMRTNAARVCKTRTDFTVGLCKLGFSVFPSQANFVWTSPPASLSAEQLYQSLWRRKILVRHFTHPRLSNHLRISIGTDEQMQALLAALAEIIDEAQAS